MKKFTVILLISALIFCTACGNTNTEEGSIGLCVRADSSSDSASKASDAVAGAIEYYLATELSEASGYESAETITRARLDTVSAIASALLRSRGYGYGAVAELEKDSCGYTATVVLKLGVGSGKRRESEVYPCAEPIAEENSGYYKSLIKELFFSLT